MKEKANSGTFAVLNSVTLEAVMGKNRGGSKNHGHLLSYFVIQNFIIIITNQDNGGTIKHSKMKAVTINTARNYYISTQKK